MEFKRTVQGNTTIFRVRGSLDSEEVLDLRLAIIEEVEKRKKNIVLNFEEVELIDIISIGYLLECLRIARKKGRDLKLVKPNNFVRQLLHDQSVTHFFEIFPTELQAINSFRMVA
jgi:anti-anti-sigma factor